MAQSTRKIIPINSISDLKTCIIYMKGGSFSSFPWGVMSILVSNLDSLFKSSSRFYSLYHPSESVYKFYQFVAMEKAVRQSESLVLVFGCDTELMATLNEYRVNLPSIAKYILPFRTLDCWGKEKFSHNPEIINERLEALVSWNSSCSNQAIWFVSLASLIQTTLTDHSIQSGSCVVNVNDDLEIDKLIDLLRTLGFREVDEVREAMTFVVRGGVLDVFPRNHSLPIRIEFMGPYVESIRSFEVDTQISIKNLDQIVVFGGGEFEMSWSSKDRAQKIYECLLTVNTKREKINGILDAVRSGYYFNGIEMFGPVLREVSETLLGKTKDLPVVFCGNVKDMISSVFQFKKDMQERFFKDVKGGLPTIDPLLHFDWKPYEDLDYSEIHSLTEDNDITISLDLLVFNKDLVDLIPSKRLDAWVDKVKSILHQNREVVIIVSEGRLGNIQTNLTQLFSTDVRLEEGISQVLSQQGIGLRLVPGKIKESIERLEGNQVLIDADVFFPRVDHGSQLKTKKKIQELISSLKELRQNEYIIHVDHGVGRYLGLEKIRVGGYTNDFIVLMFAGSDKLYLPVDKIQLLQKYVGRPQSGITLDSLRGESWTKKKQKARKSVEDLAEKLIKFHADRKTSKGIAFSAPGDLYYSFEQSFDFKETPDQLKAIEEVNHDMSSSIPMDRLICGDVGFGKTEVALRAAMRAVVDGYQVLILVPTTVLCHQHFMNFLSRFRDFGVEVEEVNRFTGVRKNKLVLERFREGRTDILIGTHRALSSDVIPKKLGLLVIDEEQKFGVKHKEMLSHLSKGCDVLSMSATPIPRTLHMAVSGMKDVSLIMTPPRRRLPVKTYTLDYRDDFIKDAIESEIDRGGQVFFVHNRVEDIEAIAQKIRDIVPLLKVGVGHGQLPAHTLEKTIIAFLEGDYSVLVCTTIIESGVDMPNVNTLIVNNADKFGLSQLYQIRGRVGRSDIQSYCYLQIDSERISDEGKRRIDLLSRFQDLGSGFQIASYDLEMRGAGNILSREQSGHIEGVGFELYTQMLDQAISAYKGENSDLFLREVEIKIPVNAAIPEGYIGGEGQRLQTYRRLFAAKSLQDICQLEVEIADRFGCLPVEVDGVFHVARLKCVLRQVGAISIQIGAGRLVEIVVDAGVAPLKKLKGYSSGNEFFQVVGRDRIFIDIKVPHSQNESLSSDILKDITQSIQEILVIGGIYDG